MIDIDDLKLASLLTEYENLAIARRERMASYTQTNFYFGVLLVIVGAAVIYDATVALVVVPLVVLIQMSIVQWNQYHHFLTEEYLRRLEREIRAYSGLQQEGMFFYSYYGRLFAQSTLLTASEATLGFFKPTALLSAFLAIFNFGLVAFSVISSQSFITEYCGEGGFQGYLAVVVGLFLLLIYNFVAMPKMLKDLLRAELESEALDLAGSTAGRDA
jgi:hypothetical protein